MHDGVDIVDALNSAMAAANAAIRSLAEHGRAKAEAEGRYRVALAKKELELRTEGKLPASLVHDLAKGDEDVARLYVRWVCAESIYDQTREEIMYRKREADVCREQLAREWSQAGSR